MPDGGEKQEGYRPHGLTLLDGGDVADLYTYVAGRMRTGDFVQGSVLHLGEAGTLAERDMHGRHLGKCVNAGLDVREGIG